MLAARRHLSHTRAGIHAHRLPLAPILTVLLLVACGCGSESGTGSEPGPAEPADLPVSEAEFIDYTAAVTLAVEEGFSGEAAMVRVSQLGVEVQRREDIEAFAAYLREHPLRWAEVAQKVDDRIEELRAQRRRTP